MPLSKPGRLLAALSLCAFGAIFVLPARAAERIVLSNGFAMDCDHRSTVADGRVKLFLDVEGTNFLEVETSKILSTEFVTPAIAGVPVSQSAGKSASAPERELTLHSMIAAAGAAHNLDLRLLESVVQAESGGHVRATSRTGARGLMQLMPATAQALGVTDSFAPEQNLRGGTAYLDQLLTRYHDDIALALAAYNAGPGAVDRYHGVPPYRETRVYVARIIREFNRRTLQNRAAGLAAGTAAHP